MTINKNNRFHASIILLFLFIAFPGMSESARGEAGQNQTLHQKTVWVITPCQAFDALCFLNTLTADSFYLDYYGNEYTKFAPKLTPQAKTSLANLKRKIKDEQGEIISATLCLYFSATNDSTIDDLLATLAESSQMQNNLKLTPYYSDDGWKLYESIRDDLGIALLFLKDIQFENYWRNNILPQEMAKIDSIKNALPKYNVISEVEEHLGFPLASDTITVFMLYYSQPHGIKITGTRFLTDMAWPFEIVVLNATHEMMHPPFRWENNPELIQTLDTLKSDEFLMSKVLHHDPSFGYNTFEGFIEEDCVQALDQIINEKLHVAKDARLRWKENDDGMHVFAVALYQVMKEERFYEKHEVFQDFLITNIRSGKLGPGKIKPIYDTFYAEGSFKK